MIERHIIIDRVDPVTFYGVNNSNIQLIRNLFPKLRMAARGSVITVIGDDNETATFEKKIHELADYCVRYNQLPEDVIIDVIKGAPPKELKMDDVIIYGVNGKPIVGRTPNHRQDLSSSGTGRARPEKPRGAQNRPLQARRGGR